MSFVRFLSTGLGRSAVVLALASPGLVLANGYWHQDNSESGVKVYPEHFVSSTSRAEQQSALATAVREGRMPNFRDGAYPADSGAAAGPGKTRQQVTDALRAETPQQRRERMQSWVGG